MIFIKKFYYPLFILVVAVAAFNLLFHVHDQMIQDWDESRPAVNAYEMVKNNNYIMGTYLDQPDYWNTKPPLALWFMAASYRIFGFNTFAMRFPSILLSIGTVILILLIVRKHFGQLASLISGYILGTSINFIIYHAGKSGDYEGGLTFLTTLSFFLLDYFKRKPVHFYLAFFVAGLAFLYKSFAFLPILLVLGGYIVVNQHFRKLKLSDYLFMLISMIAPILIWALLRMQQDGLKFFQAMIQNDLFARTQMVIEGQARVNILYYVNTIITGMMPWSFLLFVFPFYKNRLRFRSIRKGFPISLELNGFFKSSIFWLWIASMFILYGLAKTKLYWYMAPVIPAFAVYFGWNIADMIENRNMPNLFFRIFRKAMPVILLVLIIGAEALFLWSGRYTFPADQGVLMSMSRNEIIPEASFYFTDRTTQSRTFLVWVTKNFRPGVLSENDFIEKARSGDRLMVSVKSDLKTMIGTHGLSLIVSNQDWVVLEKP